MQTWIQVNKATRGDQDTGYRGIITRVTDILDTHTYFVGIRTQTFPQSKLARLLIQLTRMRRYARVN